MWLWLDPVSLGQIDIRALSYLPLRRVNQALSEGLSPIDLYEGVGFQCSLIRGDPFPVLLNRSEPPESMGLG